MQLVVSKSKSEMKRINAENIGTPIIVAGDLPEQRKENTFFHIKAQLTLNQIHVKNKFEEKKVFFSNAKRPIILQSFCQIAISQWMTDSAEKHTILIPLKFYDLKTKLEFPSLRFMMQKISSTWILYITNASLRPVMYVTVHSLHFKAV